MPPPYSAELHEVAEAMIGILRDHHEELLLKDKYPTDDRYGVVFGMPEQGMAWTPFIVVDAMSANSELQGAGSYEYTHHLISVVYAYCDWKSSSTKARLEALRRAWLVRDLLHEDLGLDNKVVYGYVKSVSPTLVGNRGDGVFGFSLSWVGQAVSTLQPGGG